MRNGTCRTRTAGRRRVGCALSVEWLRLRARRPLRPAGRYGHRGARQLGRPGRVCIQRLTRHRILAPAGRIRGAGRPLLASDDSPVADPTGPATSSSTRRSRRTARRARAEWAPSSKDPLTPGMTRSSVTITIPVIAPTGCLPPPPILSCRTFSSEEHDSGLADGQKNAPELDVECTDAAEFEGPCTTGGRPAQAIRREWHSSPGLTRLRVRALYVAHKHLVVHRPHVASSRRLCRLARPVSALGQPGPVRIVWALGSCSLRIMASTAQLRTLRAAWAERADGDSGTRADRPTSDPCLAPRRTR